MREGLKMTRDSSSISNRGIVTVTLTKTMTLMQMTYSTHSSEAACSNGLELNKGISRVKEGVKVEDSKRQTRKPCCFKWALCSWSFSPLWFLVWPGIYPRVHPKRSPLTSHIKQLSSIQCRPFHTDSTSSIMWVNMPRRSLGKTTTASIDSMKRSRSISL